jgi:hypothetical protein
MFSTGIRQGVGEAHLKHLPLVTTIGIVGVILSAAIELLAVVVTRTSPFWRTNSAENRQECLVPFSVVVFEDNIYIFGVTEVARSLFGLLEIRLISAADEENTDARKFPWLLRVSITPTVTSTATTGLIREQISSWPTSIGEQTYHEHEKCENCCLRRKPMQICRGRKHVTRRRMRR